MKGVENIKKTIIQDATTRAKEIKAIASKEAAQIKAQETQELALDAKKFREQTDILVQNYAHRTLAQARLEARKLLLRKREDIIENCTQLAVETINHSSKSYETLLKNKLDAAQKQLGKMNIFCDQKDVALIKKLSKQTATPMPIEAGFIAENKSGRIDESLAVWLEEKKSQIRTTVVQQLGE